MARVWRAWDPSLQCYVALKEPLFDPRYGAEVHEEIGRRFVREAQVGARLRGHPGIVTVYAADVYDGRPAVAMELIEGATLGDILENGPLDQEAALDALDQLLDAVGYAHSMGVVHRDLKPDNIFVDKLGRVKVADFGVAGVNDSSFTKATVVSVVLGTPGYMSPEQAMGGVADARSDLFSIGVIAYEMLTGRNPFGAGDGLDSTELLYRIVHQPVPALPPSVRASLPAGVEEAIMAALSKKPEDRPCDAAAFKEMLHKFTGDAAAMSQVGAAGALGAGAVAGAASQAGTLVVPVETSTTSLSMPEGAVARWAPILASAAVCVILLIGAIVAAPSVGGGMGSTSVSGSSSAASESAASNDAPSSSSAASSSKPNSESASDRKAESKTAASGTPSSGDTSRKEQVEQEAPLTDQSASDTQPNDGAGSSDGNAPEGEFWGVWIDAFYDMNDAYACADEASASGLPATVYEVSDENGTYYVVSAGEFSARADADYLVAQAQSLGYTNAYTSTAAHL